MIRYRCREQTRTEYVLDEVTCDRCGGKCRQVVGAGKSGLYVGASIDGFKPNPEEPHNYAEAFHVEAHLCGQCQDELIDWIQDGIGVGPRLLNEIEMSKALTAALEEAREAA